MLQESDGLSVARARIAEEAVRQTGDLDLGLLGLTQLPSELFELRHLRRLNLGRGVTIEGKEELERADDAIGSSNQIDGQLGAIGLLLNLEVLSVSGTDLSSLECFVDLKYLTLLDRSRT